MNLKERIKKSRIEKGYSQDKLAEIVGVSRGACSQWENGQSVPSVKNLAILARKLGVRFEWLSTGRGRRYYDDNMDVANPLPDSQANKSDEFLEYFHKLNSEQKSALLAFIKTLAR